MTDMDKALALVPVDQATKTAASSGLASVVLAGLVDGDKVYVPAGINVVWDIQSPKLKWLRNAGTISAQTDLQASIWCDTIVTEMGSQLNLGNEAAPITGSFVIKFADFGPVDPTVDPWMIGRGLIAMGPVTGCGSTVTPWTEHTGAKVGDTTITLVFPVIGWRRGDPIVLSGMSVTVVDDEEKTISDISPDGTQITLNSPLVYDHSAFSRRPLVVINRARRTITFESDNTDPTNAGHIMFMNNNMVNLCHASLFNKGRTRKDIPVTDPDGLGNGTTNPRARYACHFHLNGGTWADAPAIVDSCYCEGGPGWGFVNHGSFVRYQNCSVYKVYGSHFTAENGREKGGFYHCAAMRTTSTRHADDGFETDVGTTTDTARNGYGVWTHCGQTEVQDCVVTGSAAFGTAIFAQAIPFKVNGTALTIAVSDLKNPPINPITGNIISGRVPLSITNNRITGCKTGIELWTINADHPIKKTDLIGIGNLSDNFIEVSNTAITFGYSFYPFDASNLIITDPLPGGTGGSAWGHTGFTGGLNITNMQMLAVPGRAPWQKVAPGWTELDNTWVNCHFRATNGIDIPQIFRPFARSISFTGCTWDVTGFKIRCRMDHAAGSLYLGGPGLPGPSPKTEDWFSSLLTYCTDVANCYFDDTILFEGRYCHYLELHDSFPLSNCRYCPTEFSTWTQGDLWTKLGQRLGAAFLPSDAAPPTADLQCYTSAGPATHLAQMFASPFTNAYGTIYNGTDGYKGYVGVKDSAGVVHGAGEYVWPKIGLNLVPIVFDNQNRSAVVKHYPLGGMPSVTVVGYPVVNYPPAPTAILPLPYAQPDSPVPTFTASPNDTQLVGPTTATFVDNSGHVWGLGAAVLNTAGTPTGNYQVLKDGVNIGSYAMIGIHFGEIYGKTAAGAWYWREFDRWVGSSNPFVAPPPPVTVVVPNVVGMSYAQAAFTLQGVGLVISPSSVNDPTLAIATESPVAGTVVNIGSTVAVTQVPTVAVPNVVGMTFAQAKAAVESVGLVLGTTEPTVDTESPAAGTQVVLGSTVTVTLK